MMTSTRCRGVRKWHLGFRMGEGRLANSIGLNCNSLLGPNDMSQLFSHHILHPMGPMPKRILCGAFLSQLIKTRVMNLPNSVRRNLHLQYECGQIGAHKKRNSARPISCLGAAANFGNSHFALPALCMPLVFCFEMRCLYNPPLHSN